MGLFQRNDRGLLGFGRSEVGIGVVILATFLSLLAFTAVVAFSFYRAGRVVDQLDRTRESQLAANYLERSGASSVAQQKVQLTWDDAFKAIAYEPDFVWADTYIGEFLWANFRYDGMFLVSASGEPIRAWGRGEPMALGRYAELSGEVRRQLAAMPRKGKIYGAPAEYRQLADTRWPFDAKGRPLTRWSTAMVRYQGKPAILTVAAVLPDTDYAMLVRSPNHLVAVRSLDPVFLGEMSDALLIDRIEALAHRAQGADANSLALTGAQGEPLGWLGWTTVPDSTLLRDKVKPLFLGYLVFLLVVVGGGTVIVRRLLATMRQLRVREALAHHSAMHDAMTGLPNRAHFLERLTQLLAARDPDPDDLILVAYFDIDHFKNINDTQGHHIGDELIAQVALRWRKTLGPEDVLARMGGDEFVLMRRARRSSTAALGIGKEVMANFAEPFVIAGQSLDVSASCGISWSPDVGIEAGELLRNADIALYRAKQRGRARFRFFTADMESAVRERHALEVDLRRAIAAGALSAEYQPIVRARDGRIESLEALLRWRHPVHGDISPSIFVPIAEQSGLMGALGWWMLRRVFAEHKAWPEVDISINLSPLQLMAHEFVDNLEALIAELDVDSRRFTLEVTEGVLLESRVHTFAVLERLKALGFTIALDDFGTGYSSLSYLRNFHFDRIKIDRSFVQNIENDLDAMSILKAIVALGRSLRMKIVAEGVESPLQRQLVMAAGCEYIQGHLYWRAMSPDEIDALLRSGEAPRELRRAG